MGSAPSAENEQKATANKSKSPKKNIPKSPAKTQPQSALNLIKTDTPAKHNKEQHQRSASEIPAKSRAKVKSVRKLPESSLRQSSSTI